MVSSGRAVELLVHGLSPLNARHEIGSLLPEIVGAGGAVLVLGVAQGLLGQELPFVEMPVAPGRHLAVLLEVTSRNQLLKRKGYFPARGLASELDRRIRDGRQDGKEPSGTGGEPGKGT